MAQHILFGIPDASGRRLLCELSIPEGTPEEFLRIVAMQPHLKSLTIDQRIHINVARLAVRWHMQNPIALPRIDDIARLVYEQKICGCTDTVPRSSILRVLALLLSWRLMQWPCAYIELAVELERAQGRLPTADDMRAAVVRATAPEDVARRTQPTGISQWIQTRGLGNDDDCALCCNSLTDFEVAAEMPRNPRQHYCLPCGHKFHYHEAFCIEGAVRRWFETKSTCPVCRRDYAPLPS